MRKKYLITFLIIFIGVFALKTVYANENIEQNSIEPKLNTSSTEKSTKNIDEYLNKKLYITPKISDRMVLDVQGVSKRDGANLQIWGRANKISKNQIFEISKTQDGFYEIKAYFSGKMVDVDSANFKNWTNVFTYTQNKTDAQKWNISVDEEGYVTFYTKGDLCLDVDSGIVRDGTNIQIYRNNGSDCQKFKLNIYDYDVSKMSKLDVEEGRYVLQVKDAPSRVLDVEGISFENNANIQIWGKGKKASENQMIDISKNSDGTYKLKFVHSGKCMDIVDGFLLEEQNIQQYRDNNSIGQKWEFYELNGNILIKAAGIDFFVGVTGFNEGSNVLISEVTDKTYFKMSRVEIPQKVNQGDYYVSLALNENLIFDVKDLSSEENAQIQIWGKSLDRTINQIFKLVEVEDSMYKIVSRLSNKVLSIKNGQLVQTQDKGLANQKWKFMLNDDGSYRIQNYDTEEYIYCEQQKEGTILKLSNNYTSLKLNVVEKKSGTKSLEDGVYVINDINQKYIFDIEAISYEEKANCQVWGKASTQTRNQMFKIQYNGDGSYTIISMHTGKKLTNVKNNIVQTNTNGEDTQWIISKNIDGSYSISTNTVEEKYITIQGDIKEGSNVGLEYSTGSTSQKFMLENVREINSEKVLNDGYYEILVDDKKTFDIKDVSVEEKAQLQIWDNSRTLNQKFKFEYKDGYYEIINVNSGLYLTASGTYGICNVYQMEKNENENQKWIIRSLGNNNYEILNKINFGKLCMEDNSLKNGARVVCGDTQVEKAYIFKINKTTIVEYNIYELELEKNSIKALDIDIASSVAQIWDINHESYNQKFSISFDDLGNANISCYQNNMALTNVNDDIVVDSQKGIAEQKWEVVSAKKGYFYIKQANTNKYFSIEGSITNGAKIVLREYDSSIAVKFKLNGCESYLKSINIDTNRYPGYKEKILDLQKVHPNWNFEFIYTGIRLADAVNGESVHGKNLVPKNSAGEWICPICGTKSYDSGWYCASTKAIAYYMDPRNALDEGNVFQFLALNEFPSNSISIDGINKKVSGTFLQSYGQAIYNACANTGVNPYYITTRILQEQGSSGTVIGTGMNGGDGKIYYNPFNIGAYGSGNAEIIANALSYAKKAGWDTMQKGIEGGISFCKKAYLENYQDTLYTNKFNIDSRSSNALYTHQYMQNLMAAYSEGLTLRSMYSSTSKLDEHLTFKIPLYEDINSIDTSEPKYNSENSPKNFKVIANGGLNLRSTANVTAPIIDIVPQGEIVLSIERSTNSVWQKVMLKNGTTGYVDGTYLEQVNDVTTCNYLAYARTPGGTAGVNLRYAPGIRSSIDVAEEEIVTVIDDSTYKNIDGNNWCRVILSSGIQGFLPSQYVHKK